MERLTLDEFLNKFNRTMNNAEINNISNNGIREIKKKYWTLKHNAFIDEHHISDSELKNVWDSLSEKERNELTTYYNEKFSNQNH